MGMFVELSNVEGDAEVGAASSARRARIAIVVGHVHEYAPILLGPDELDGLDGWADGAQKMRGHIRCKVAFGSVRLG